MALHKIVITTIQRDTAIAILKATIHKSVFWDECRLICGAGSSLLPGAKPSEVMGGQLSLPCTKTSPI